MCVNTIMIVRILLFWYSKQTFFIKWRKYISGYFSIAYGNGVRQSGILSLKLFFVYIYDLYHNLVTNISAKSDVVYII